MSFEQEPNKSGQNLNPEGQPSTRVYSDVQQIEYERRLRQEHPELFDQTTAEVTHAISPKRSKGGRRGLKITAGTLVLATILGFATDGRIPFIGNDQKPNPTEPGSSNGPIPSAEASTIVIPSSNPEAGKTNGQMVLSETEESFQKEMIGYMNWTPDGPITYWTTAEGTRRYLLTGGNVNATYMLETDGKRTLKEIMASGEINADSFKKVYGPDQNVEYRREYAGITSVLQIDKSNPDHLLGIVHCEERTSRDASADYTATIGLTESFDGGLTWMDKGPLITGTDVKAPGGGRVSGAGQPTAYYNEKDGYAYIMYIDWSAKGEHPDQLYMARMKANGEGSLGQIEYYTEGGFSTDKQNLKSVIPVPSGGNVISVDKSTGIYTYLGKQYAHKDFPLKNGNDLSLVYIALPHLSWNKDLNEYIAEGESTTGFWHSVSKDLVNWSTPEIEYDFIIRGGKPDSVLLPGEKWDSYPTALSENEPNSQIIDNKGIFYHSSGDNLSPHEPSTLDFNIK